MGRWDGDGVGWRSERGVVGEWVAVEGNSVCWGEI